ncbi:zinc-binding dehydrogenase [Marinicauda salina]|uniref:Zinc-binding dehydrogenase n=1 Tax=Marinicauda salina TaxID=2135793 RepID=A0A2U2BUX8_9PROT|nr:NADPH:quinone reductase [Marinicauda salina]PWE17797.1 zinc-binding dehydrogenase [Marinicauda salina]
MKAVWFERFGEPDVLEFGERPAPTPGKGEVLVRLAASGVNPSDTKKRRGSFPNLLDNGYVIPHSDGAGVVEAVGEGVSSDRVGERVWVYQAQHGRRFGSAAEYVAIDEARAPALPENADFRTGACYGIPVMTAHRCVFADGDPGGLKVLVTGGAGRVGYYAIQWAANAGAEVIATASNAEDAETCRAAGAAHVVNHRDDDWGSRVLEATGGERVDRVVDVEFGANLSQVLECIRTGGVIATYSSSRDMQPTLPFYRMMFMDLTVRMVIVYDMPEAAKKQAIADIAAAEAAGRLSHRFAEAYPLERCADAHAAIEAGNRRGCVIVDIGGAED